MVLHGLKRIFQKPTPDISSSERTNQLRSKTIYSGTVNLSSALTTPGSNRYKTYNGPFEIINDNGSGSLVASASYKDLLDITKGKVLLNQLPLTSLTANYYEKNFGNGEMYVGNYQQFDGSFFSGGGGTGPGPTDCEDSVLVYDISTPGFTGPGSSSYPENSIGVTGATVTDDSNQDIFIDPKHCYYSDPCASSASYMKFVDVDLKGANGSSQYYAQKIINANQYSGFCFPMSNFNLTCVQQIMSQAEGPLFCPPEPPTFTGSFYIPNQNYSLIPSSFPITLPTSNSGGAFSPYTVSPSNPAITFDDNHITINANVSVGTYTVTVFQEADGIFSSRGISTNFNVVSISPTLTGSFSVPDQNYSPALIPFSFPITPPTSNSGGAFSYTVSPRNPSITFRGNSVTINANVSVGAYTIIARQAAAGNFTSSNSVTAFFHVNAISPTLTGSLFVPDQNYSPALIPFSFQIIPPTSNSRGAFSYAVSPRNPLITFNGNNVIINANVSVGAYTIIATQAAAGNFTSSNTVTASFRVNAIPPTFTGSFSIPHRNYSLVPFSFPITPPTSNSAGAFSYTVSPSNPAITFDGNNVTINANVSVGTYTVTVFQAAAGNFSSGSVSTSFNVVPISPTLTGSFSIPHRNYSLIPFAFPITPPTSNSRGAFSYTVSPRNPSITFRGNSVTINANVSVGTYTVTVFQAAAGNFTSSGSVSTSFNVVPVSPTFIGSFSIPNQNYSLVPFSFPITPPTSNSGGAISSYAVSPNNHSVIFDGSSVTIDADVPVGTYTITVFQEEDDNFTEGSVKATFNVLPLP